MILWGFISSFFVNHSEWVAQAAGVLIAGVLLWDVVFRGNLGFSLSFFEELWSRNLGHLFASPLRPVEHIVALTVMSFIRTVIGAMPAMGLAIVFYHYSIFDMGWALVAFFVNLMVTGWCVGVGVSALVLRFGLGAESLAWVLVFALVPLSGVYYPIATLPEWLQPLAWALPPAYVFEGMRAVLFEHTFRFDLLAGAVLLNGLYFIVGVAVFLRVFHVARRKGLLLNVGE